MSILKSCILARIVLALLPSNAHFPLLEAMLKKGWPKNPELSIQLWKQMQLNKPCFTQLHYLVPQNQFFYSPQKYLHYLPFYQTEAINICLNELNYLGAEKKNDEQSSSDLVYNRQSIILKWLSLNGKKLWSYSQYNFSLHHFF